MTGDNSFITASKPSDGTVRASRPAAACNGHVTTHNGAGMAISPPSTAKPTYHMNGITNGTASKAAETRPFYQRVLALVEELELPCAVQHERDSRPPLLRFHQPSELAQLLPMQLGEPVASEDELLQLCRRAAELSVRTDDVRFRNQLFGGMDKYGLAGALLTECLNTSQYTYEVSPVFTLCEAELLAKVRRIIGWSSGDGIFAAGGSMSNQYALAMARYNRHPEVKTQGMFGAKPMVVFTSVDSHYSIMKAANWHGFGSDNVVQVGTDSLGRMRPDLLLEAVQRVLAEGREPLFVNATCGTTVLGAYDPVPAIADICQQYGLWLHVDACWGGAAMLSRRWRHLLTGIERADSVAWNPHKMLGAPQQCALIVTRHEGLMHHCNSAKATYLFQQDKFYDVSYDTGDKSIQCGRKVDAFKLWVMWKAHGDAGLERIIDTTFAASRFCAAEVARRPGFRPVLPSNDSQCANVSFWYVPEALRGQEETEEWWQRLDQVAPRIKEGMMRSGSLMVSYQPLPSKRFHNFFRLVFTGAPQPSEQDVTEALDEIARIAEGL
ncbi:Cysteine sulfinic acid decarboxylase [Amphibalanus amphitrite]|uniref:Cysteine sulfinic acid decarboxylase n=1 Tax=Amphibalanus amphitrite TaxID=1232801 RepID=A0A6A4VWW1_AMPAM|nr:Cysteine sulfinic acid decarboxylase [Amphibalanus amphitrite]